MQPATHTLKAHPPMYDALKRGVKNFEVRKDDRAFQCGDTLIISYHKPEWDLPSQYPSPPRPSETDKPALNYRVTFVLRGGQYGVETGYVVLSLERLPTTPEK